MNFIKSTKSHFTYNQRKTLKEEFDLVEDKNYITLSIDKTVVGEVSPISNNTEAEGILLADTNKVVEEFILGYESPFLFKSLRDEGYQIQKWYKDTQYNYWLSPSQENNRVLYLINVLHSKGASLEFKYHKSINLIPGRVLVFPSLFTHAYKINPGKITDLYIATTFVDIES